MVELTIGSSEDGVSTTSTPVRPTLNSVEFSTSFSGRWLTGWAGSTGSRLRLCVQAEDGIRDLHVTGVQTCALPISRGEPAGAAGGRGPQECGGAPGAGAS